MANTKSKKGFNYSMLALIVFAMAFIVQLTTANLNSDFFSLAIGVAALVAFTLAIIGLVSSVQGLQEPISMEQIVGVTINGVFFVGFIFIIAEAVMTLDN